jgi:WD40 repeat protein
MVSGTDSGKTKFWFIEKAATDPTASLVRTVDSGAVYALAWSPDGTRIVAGEGGDITVYDSTDLTDVKILFRNVDAHAGRVNDVAFSPDSSMIVSGGADGALKLWSIPPTP